MYSNEEHKARCRKYYQEHKTEIKEKIRKEYWENREKLLARAKRNNQKPERKKKIAEYQKKYRGEHKEEIKKKRKSYHQAYYQRIKETKKAKEKEYRKNNADRINARKRELRILNPERFSRYDKNHFEKRKHLLKQIRLISNPFPPDINVDFHHVYPPFPFTVPMPKMIHQTYNMELEKHIQFNKEWFEKLYGIDIDIILGINPGGVV